MAQEIAEFRLSHNIYQDVDASIKMLEGNSKLWVFLCMVTLAQHLLLPYSNVPGKRLEATCWKGSLQQLELKSKRWVGAAFPGQKSERIEVRQVLLVSQSNTPAEFAPLPPDLVA